MKDHETFFRGAGLLIRRLPAVHFLLGGAGVSTENPPLAQMARKNGLDGRVHFLGPRDDIPRLTAALDLGTSASVFGEGFCNAIGEAMACGVPCVATDVGDSAPIIGHTGRVVPPRDASALADAWASLLGMPEKDRRALGAAARERIASLFQLRQIIRKYEELYLQIVGNPLQCILKTNWTR